MCLLTHMVLSRASSSTGLVLELVPAALEDMQWCKCTAQNNGFSNKREIIALK